MGARIGGGRFRTLLLLNYLHLALAFVGNLKKIKPKAVVAAVKGSAPKAATALTEKRPALLVANAIDQNKEVAEQIQSASSEDAKRILEQGQAQARESVREASEAAEAFGAAAVTYASTTTTTTVSTTSTGVEDVNDAARFRLADAVDAETLARAGAGFAQVKQQLRDSKLPIPAQAEDIVRGHMEQHDHVIAQAVKSSGAGKGLQWIKNAVTRDGMPAKSRTESFVVENAQDSNMKAVIQDTEKVLQGAERVTKSKLASKLTGRTSSDSDGEEAHSVENEAAGVPILNHSMSRSWQWFVCGGIGVLCTIALAWHLVVRAKRRERRSPTLLVENEANILMAC